MELNKKLRRSFAAARELAVLWRVSEGGGEGGLEYKHANNSDTFEATKNARGTEFARTYFIFVDLFLYRLDIIDARFFSDPAANSIRIFDWFRPGF